MTFAPMPFRLRGELEHRKAQAGKALRYYQTFLDDCLRGILPHDLVLIGAPSGIGKTDLALSIAASNAQQKKRVHYFALEAEPMELERRTKFALLSMRAHRAQVPSIGDLNYADWLLGRCEHLIDAFNPWADRHIAESLATLNTYYRGAKFDVVDLASQIIEVHEQTDLVVVDHLHYVDQDESDEHRALGDTVKVIRDVSLRIGKPIVLVAHLRKRDMKSRHALATLDDFHGSSNIVKICTQAIALDHAYDIEPTKWYLAPTYLTVLKDRRAGAPRVVALTDFDRRTKSYTDTYTLGRLERGSWVELPFGSQPSWAKRHRPREAI